MTRSLFARLAAGFALVHAGLLGVSAEPTVKEIITYYDITGTTPEVVRNHLNFSRPKNERDGISYDSITRWSVYWRFAYQNGAQGCAIATVSATVDASIVMPRLAAETEAPPALTRAFADYTEKLLVHERGHVKNGVDIARRIEDGIRVLPPRRSCDELARSANALGDSLLKEGNRMDVEYDARTQHGLTQGVRFP